MKAGIKSGFFIFILFIIFFTSCKKAPDFCAGLANKEVVYTIAKSTIEKKISNNIWNLSGIDTTDFFTTEDYFITNKERHRLVLLGGNAGLSAGTADNLLILFNCVDTPDIIWCGQVGDIVPDGIRDLNNDGIKELIITSASTWMGECNEVYEIMNFENQNRNSLYKSVSTSVIDCGIENIENAYKQGDTLETHFQYFLFPSPDKLFKLREVKTIKVNTGGKSTAEIINNLKIVSDTTIIDLK